MKVMIDLETLDTEPTAKVLEIGWCIFDEEIQVPKSFIVPLKLQEGRTISGDTLNWHLDNNNGRELIEQADAKPVDLDLLSVQFAELAAAIKHADELWCYGASFDFPILKNLLKDLSPKYVEGWDFRKERCLRTWCALNNKKLLSKNTHRAKEDIINQANTLIQASQPLQ